jgi:hypothetical protein
MQPQMQTLATQGWTVHHATPQGVRREHQLTKTREAHSARMPAWAAGGATSVPSDHSATPASSTFVPPILQTSPIYARCKYICAMGAAHTCSIVHQRRTTAYYGAFDAVRQGLEPHRVDTQPAGIWVREYPQKKADDTRPLSLAVHLSSAAMGITATDMFTCMPDNVMTQRWPLLTLISAWHSEGCSNRTPSTGQHVHARPLEGDPSRHSARPPPCPCCRAQMRGPWLRR